MTDDVVTAEKDETPLSDRGEPLAMHHHAPDPDGVALTDLATDDRLAMLEPALPIARRFRMLLPVVVVSLAVHVGLVVIFGVLVKEPQAIAEEQETPVEVVAEAPQPEAKKEAKAAAAAPQAEPKPADAEKPRAEQAQAKTPEAKTPEAKAPEPKQDLPKPEKPVETAKAEPDAKVQPDVKPGAPDKAAEDAKTLQSLQNELATLKAQAADLQAQQAMNPESNKDIALLPDSFAAVAAPRLSADGEGKMTYQQAVYSLIAKAKKSGGVFVPGVAHVVFNVGANGEVLDVTLDHSSGNPVVDTEAVAIVRRAAPFPPPPPGAPRSFPAYMSFVDDQ